MPAVGVDRLQARADDLHHFMLAKANQLGQRGPDAFLVVRNQDAHTAVAELSMPAGFNLEARKPENLIILGWAGSAAPQPWRRRADYFNVA
jgi:hypothetical protein